MKDFTEEEWRASRPENDDALDAIDFCLESLFMDKQRTSAQVVCKRLSYEELIGALLLAEDEIKKLKEYLEEYMDED